ncbi:sensor histidine kinase [Streptomyces sp. NPDC059819]|uniref:sensor histidine kinase n=1 Tax=Streptomyces sp. NPDC059819 TaxID=3346963 RepID=UPI00365AF5AD
MPEQATENPPVTAAPRHRARNGDSPALAPAFAGSLATGAAVAGGWMLDEIAALPEPAGVAAAVAAAGCALWWTGMRSLRARRALPGIMEAYRQRDAALHALNQAIATAERGRSQVREAAHQAEQGIARTASSPAVAFTRSGNPCTDAAGVLAEAFDEAHHAILLLAARQHQQLSAQSELVDIFTSISPRLLSLVNRGISVISKVEEDIEDPEMMAGLFRVDHVLTQIRRAVESLAVLGGNTPPRDSTPVLLATAIRRAVAEIPAYARVRVEWSPRGTAALPGYVSPNVVHLLAALMENATRFSSDRVYVHIHQAADAIAIEILDRGPGMSQQKRESLNSLLAAPEREDPGTRLRRGTIGLLVAALLAKRHRITIQLGPNIVGGTQAVVAIPRELFVSPGQHDVPQTVPAPRPVTHPPALTVLHDHVAPRRRDINAPPQHIPSDRPPENALDTAPQPSGSRPQLPRRGEAERRVPPMARQAPSGPPTADLMAAFRTRRPSTPPAAPQPPPAG